MIDHSYIGSWSFYDNDELKWLMDNGVTVLWHRRWEDYDGNEDARMTEREWRPVTDFEELEQAHFKCRRGRHRQDDRFSIVEISWRIPDEKYPLIDARARQRDREFWKEYEEKCYEAQLMRSYRRPTQAEACGEQHFYDTQIAPEARI